MVPVSTFNDAKNQIADDGVDKYIGVIVDLRLDGDNNGSDLIDMLVENYRIPIAVYSGTPYETDIAKPIKIPSFLKGKDRIDDVIRYLVNLATSPLFKILGGNGQLDKKINRIFWENLYSKKEAWDTLRNEGIEVDEVLVRYMISHLHEMLGDTDHVAQEMYLSPPVVDRITTGSILEREDGRYFVVMSPPCDLVFHKEKPKSNTVTLCEIESVDKLKSKNQFNDGKIFKNRLTEYHHWLPQCAGFEGGCINFRLVSNQEYKSLNKFKNDIKISDSFMKDILRRFSAYYGRQGQPDFLDEEIKKMEKLMK